MFSKFCRFRVYFQGVDLLFIDHERFFLCFCQQITLSSLGICMDNPLYLLGHLPLVQNSLVFHSAHLSQKDCGAFVKVALKQSKRIK